MEPSVVVLTPIILGLVQVVKMTNLVPHRFLPILAILIGIAGALGFGIGTTPDLVMNGIILGLGAVGLYEVGKTSVLNK